MTTIDPNSPGVDLPIRVVPRLARDMTLREHVAADAIYTAERIFENFTTVRGPMSVSDVSARVAEIAVSLTDALLAELAKPTAPPAP